MSNNTLSAAQISVYQDSSDPERGPDHHVYDLGWWIDQQSFCSEELSSVFRAWSDGRLHYGGGGAAAAWAVKLYEPYDEQLDPWSDVVPEHALASANSTTV